jgi:hypothetical protein
VSGGEIQVPDLLLLLTAVVTFVLMAALIVALDHV